MNQRSSKFASHSQSESRRARPTTWLKDGAAGAYLTGLMWFNILFLSISGSVFTGSVDNGSTLGQANPISRAIKLGLLTLSLFIIWRRRRLAALVLQQVNRFFVILLVLVPVSLLWSIDPGATIARYLSMLSIVCVCFSFVLMSWHPKRFQQVLRPVLIVVLLASFAYGIARPDLAIERGEGTLANAWKGLISQKNEFGMWGGFAFILWLHAWLNREATAWAAVVCCAIGGFAVLLSRSSTSLLSTMFASMLMLMLMRSPGNLRRYTPFIVAMFAIAVVIYAVAVLNLVPGLDVILSPFTTVTGKDMTFSNRSEIWKIVEEHVQLSPWIGSGYGAYWTGQPSSPAEIFRTRMNFYPSEAHNGYLEVVNDLGFVGLIFLLGFLAVYVRQSLQLMKLDRAQGVLFLAFFFQQAMTNLSESTWLAMTFAFIFMTLANFTLARYSLEHRFRQHLGVHTTNVGR